MLSHLTILSPRLPWILLNYVVGVFPNRMLSPRIRPAPRQRTRHHGRGFPICHSGSIHLRGSNFMRCSLPVFEITEWLHVSFLCLDVDHHPNVRVDCPFLECGFGCGSSNTYSAAKPKNPRSIRHEAVSDELGSGAP